MAQPLIRPTVVHDPELDNPPPEKRSVRKAVLWIIFLLFVLLLVVIGVRSLRKSQAQPQGQAQAGQGGGRRGGAGGDPSQRAIPVAVATVQQQDVPVYLEGLGNVQAYYTVTIHSRV